MGSDLISRVRGLGELLQASARPKAEVGSNQFYKDRLALTRAVFSSAEDRAELGDGIVRLTQALAEAEAALEKIAEAKIGMAAGNIYFTSDQSVLQQCKIIAAQALTRIRAAKGGE